MQDPAPLVFKPRPPDNRRACILTSIFLVPYVFITVLMWYISLWVAIPWLVVLLPTLLVVFLLLFRSSSAVSYRLEADALVLRYWRLVNYRLPYSTIRDVKHYTLTTQNRPPMRGTWALMPGLDTTAYRTDDAGDIKMLATASAGSIVLIKSESGNYGVNPTDEEGFISTLRQRISWDIDAGPEPVEQGEIWLGDNEPSRPT
jgi:hypothetical protein